MLISFLAKSPLADYARFMVDSIQLHDLLRRCRNGEEDAASTLYALYARRLGLLAERQLCRGLPGRIDSDDILQSVFRTFFRRCARGDFRIDNDQQLWQLLVKVTLMKARANFHAAAARDVRAESPVDREGWLADALAQEAGPEDLAALRDTVDTLLRDLPALYTRVLELRLAGYSGSEIAGQTGVSRHTVYRALHLLEQRLSE